jgi:general stress protein YciG
MAIRPNSEERSFGADRERQREVSNESSRTARASSSDNAARGDQGNDSGQARSRSNRGFASMDREKQREIASKGGRAAHQKGTAHEFDSSEARAAGRKGGVTVSRNREHMAAIGRRGGEARGANRAARMQQGGNGISASAGQANGQSNNASPAASNSPRFQSDREVGLRNGGLANGNAGSANRSSGNSLGGERNSGANAERNIERP